MGGRQGKKRSAGKPSALHYAAAIVGKVPVGGIGALKPGEIPVEFRRHTRRSLKKRKRKDRKRKDR